MNRPSRVAGLKAATVAAVALAGSIALPTGAYAGTGPGGHCAGTWTQGYTGNGYTASCTVSGGLPGSTEPYQFRVKITCTRAGHPTTTAYGTYSDWKSSANCASGYDPSSPVIQWVQL